MMPAKFKQKLLNISFFAAFVVVAASGDVNAKCLYDSNGSLTGTDGGTDSSSCGATGNPTNNNGYGNTATKDGSYVGQECVQSNAIGGNYGTDCVKANSLAQTSQIANLAGEAITSETTQVTGALNSQNVTSQAAAYQGAANTLEISAAGSGLMGTGDLVLGYMQYKNMSNLNANAQALTAAQAKAKQDAGNAITAASAVPVPANNTDLNNVSSQTPPTAAQTAAFKAVNTLDSSASVAPQSTVNNANNPPPTQIQQDAAKAAEVAIWQSGAGANNLQGGDNRSYNNFVAPNAVDQSAKPAGSPLTYSQHALGQVAATAGQAATEQNNLSTQAEYAMAQTLITGTQQLMSAGVSQMQANADRSAASALNTANTTGVAFAPTAGNLSPTTSASDGSTSINPGTGATTATAAVPGGASNGTNLGTGITTPNAGGGGGGGVTPSAFTPGQPTAASSGSNPSMGGSGTSPAAATDDPQAKSADTGRQQLAYGGGGGAAYVPGGVGSDKGENLSGLLGQLLPKKEDKTANGEGIMNFGSRDPASTNTLLGRNVNLFKRIEDSMQSNYRRGTVGI